MVDKPEPSSGRKWYSFLEGQFAQVLRNEILILAVLAGILGVAIGYAALAFRLAIALVQEVGFGSPREIVFLDLSHLPWWQIVLAPTLGGLLVGLMTRFLIRGDRVHGVAEVMESAAYHNSRLPWRDAVVSAAASAVSLGSGASAGREGPVVHLGASIASWAASILHLPAHLTRTLLGCGVAAAIAASFNAPIAGVFFALEVIVGHYALHAFAPIVLASVAGTVVSRIYMGDFPAFIVPEYDIGSAWEVPAFMLLGAISAVTAVIFIRSWHATVNQLDRRGPPTILRPAMGGLIIGAIGTQFPQILSVGYAATDAALKEMLGLKILVILLIAKVIATVVSLAARFGGGVFSPAIFMGAMLGGAFGMIATSVFPDVAGSHGLYAIVGMGAVASAVLGAPISTILIVFELTGDYEITIALMVAVVVSGIITNFMIRGSFFHWQLLRRGVDVRGGRAEQLARMAYVEEAMTPSPDTVAASTTAESVRQIMGNVLVCDEEGGVIGILNRDTILKAPAAATTAGDMAAKPETFLRPEDSLVSAINVFEETGLDALPVVADSRTRSPAGILHERDALKAYNRILLDARKEEQGGMPGRYI